MRERPRTTREWLALITQCRSSGLTDKEWCEQYGVNMSTFYNAINRLRKMLEENQLVCSMSRKGDCWDNAPMESFWGKMKSEWLKKKYATIDEAKRDVIKYIWEFYPRMRPHEKLSYQTLSQYYSQQGKSA